MLHQLHLCFLLAILLLFCPKTGRANAYEEKDIEVSTHWQKSIYNNDNIKEVTQKIIHTIGIIHRESTTKTLVASHTAGILAKGDLFKVSNIELSYTFGHQKTRGVMSENEIYSSRTIETTVTIPPRSTITRWELIADVAGTTIHYSHYIDALNDTRSTPQTYTSRAKVLVRRRIYYGHTRIRIKHEERNEYVTVIERKGWPAATLGHSSRYVFILCHDSRGVRIKTLNTTYSGYVWAYSSTAGGLYFDWHRQIGSSYDSNVDVQHWSISKEEPLRDGDKVTFRNKYYTDSAMCYYEGYTTNVYCITGLEHKWVLETVDVRDCPIDNCR